MHETVRIIKLLTKLKLPVCLLLILHKKVSLLLHHRILKLITEKHALMSSSVVSN